MFFSLDSSTFTTCSSNTQTIRLSTWTVQTLSAGIPSSQLVSSLLILLFAYKHFCASVISSLWLPPVLVFNYLCYGHSFKAWLVSLLPSNNKFTSFLIEDKNTLFDNFFDRLSAFMDKPKHKLLQLVVNMLTQLNVAISPKVY